MSDFQTLLDRCVDALQKDLKHISFEVVKGKLKPNLAKDLATYTKLLSDLNKEKKKEDAEETDELSKLTEEELRARAKQVLQDS